MNKTFILISSLILFSGCGVDIENQDCQLKPGLYIEILQLKEQLCSFTPQKDDMRFVIIEEEEIEENPIEFMCGAQEKTWLTDTYNDCQVAITNEIEIKDNEAFGIQRVHYLCSDRNIYCQNVYDYYLQFSEEEP